MPVAIHRIEGGKIAEHWSGGTGLSELRRQLLEQEIAERERVEQELRVARRIQQASLPREVPEPEGWQLSPASDAFCPSLSRRLLNSLAALPLLQWSSPTGCIAAPKYRPTA